VLTRNAEASVTRYAIAVGFSASCAALVALGTYEYVAGHAGSGLLMAVAVEAVLALTFAVVRYADRRIGST
jgi:uncharacterized membrane protein